MAYTTVNNSKQNMNTKRWVGNASNQTISGIGFGMGDYFEMIKDNQTFDVCYSIDENEWNGKKTLQLRLRDIKE